jgi:hypothetical protein
VGLPEYPVADLQVTNAIAVQLEEDLINVMDAEDVADEAGVVDVVHVVMMRVVVGQDEDDREVASVVMLRVLVAQCADAGAPNADDAHDVVLFCKKKNIFKKLKFFSTWIFKSWWIIRR